ncbi:MAG TPA: TetR/AcrR family transcriptional regulator [Leptolinea sp.]
MNHNPVVENNDQETMRVRILNHATRLFVASGYIAISMREIAEAVGVSKAGLYYHFKDKEDLFIAILKDNLEEVGRIVTYALQTAPDAFTRLRIMTTRIFQQPPQQRAIIRLASQEMGNINPQTRADFMTTYHNEFIGRIETILQEGIDRGELRPNPPSVTCWILLGMMYPFFYPDPSRNEVSAEIIAEQIVQLFFYGLGIPEKTI